MRKISALLLLAHILVLPLVAQSQSTKVLSDYIKEINQFNKRNPQEKVYLHFDNTGYFLGDTIWFKAYNVLAEHHRFSPLSKVLHVELLTPQGEVIANRKLMIENGQCHGEFPLKRIYRSGFYEVRAYTRGMLNFGDDCVFSRVFPVYDEPEKDGNYSEKAMDSGFGVKNKRKIEKKGDKVNIAFFPEGLSVFMSTLDVSDNFKGYTEHANVWFGIDALNEAYKQSTLALILNTLSDIGMFCIGFFILSKYPNQKVIYLYNTATFGAILLRAGLQIELLHRMGQSLQLFYFIPLGYAFYLLYTIKIRLSAQKNSICRISTIFFLIFTILYYGRFILMNPRGSFIWNH